MTTTLSQAAESSDPFESINRNTMRVNNVVDAMLLRPVSGAYERYAPDPAKSGIRNFFSNLDDVVVVVNDLLQLKFRQAGRDFGRLTLNSTLGVGGLFNVAGRYFALHKNAEDFGQTLGYWGVGPGPYIVLPLLGPSNLRDTLGVFTDTLTDPVFHVESSAIRDKIVVARIFESRARALRFDGVILGDEYLFLRDVYLQNREFLISDGRNDVVFEDFQ